jgi:archaellum component FlaF (FlaF/FlaG flagellin family)
MLKNIFNITKLTVQMALVMAIGFLISFGIYISVSESVKMPSSAELSSLDNISSNLNSKETNAVEKSRHSILHVLSGYDDGDGFAKMSGTYVTHDGDFYVITAAHGIVSDCAQMFVATDSDNVYECERYVLIDKHVDYAIIQIEEVPDRRAVKLKDVVPAHSEWLQETAVLNEVFYTGYPNGLGPLTFRGSVAGMSDHNYILLHSYAWPGSSGSGVFSYDGNMIGIIIALNVGFTAAGYDVLEDLVIVTPLFMIDWDTAYQIMDEPMPSGDTGDTGQ